MLCTDTGKVFSPSSAQSFLGRPVCGRQEDGLGVMTNAGLSLQGLLLHSFHMEPKGGSAQEVSKPLCQTVLGLLQRSRLAAHYGL